MSFYTEEKIKRLHDIESILQKNGASKINIYGYKYLFNVRNMLIHFEFDTREFAIYLGNVNKKWTQVGGIEVICFIGIPILYAFLNGINPNSYVKEKDNKEIFFIRKSNRIYFR